MNMFDSMPKIVGSRDIGHAHIWGKFFVCPPLVSPYKAMYQIWSL